MKILIGSYNKGIYEVGINLDSKVFESKKMISNVLKPSYLMKDLNLSYIYSKNDLGYIKIENQDVLLEDGATHLSYDNHNNVVYTSFYGAGKLKVLKKNDVWHINQTITYPAGTNIHYASYIPNVNQVGVVDLGHDKIYFYDYSNQLILKSTYEFDKGFGPRHFINHPILPIIYVISELIPTVHVLEYKDDVWVETNSFKLEKGAGSAIRISSCGKHLFAAVRFSNLLYHFNVDQNGNISLNEVYPTMGDHPRDFNLINNDKYLVILNMHSDSLTLYELSNNKLILRDSNFNLDHGASIIYNK